MHEEQLTQCHTSDAGCIHAASSSRSTYHSIEVGREEGSKVQSGMHAPAQLEQGFFKEKIRG
jgi:hypothetical protein